MLSQTTEPATDRPAQILRAAMVCFAQRGFHQASMHDISAEAGISVGLIYRYFENKDAVISAMADQHEQQLQCLLAQAREAPSLLDALEVFFTAHCSSGPREIHAAFVVDLFAEGSRNPQVAQLVRKILDRMIGGVTELIAQSPDARQMPAGMTPRQAAEIIFAASRGTMMRDVLDAANLSDAEQLDRQLVYVRQLWRLLFNHANEPAFA